MIRPGSDFEWDEAKNLTNTVRHGITFQEAVAVFEGDYQEFEDKRRDYGEARAKIIGVLGNRVVSVICTQRGSSVRIISARRARRDERREYRQIYPG